MGKPIRRCAKCRERRVAHTTEPYYVTLDHDGRSYAISIAELTMLKCTKCGTRILDDEADDRVSTALRTAAGLLQPDEIRAKRLAQGLTQKQLADRLGFAEATLSRWESGGQIQQRFYDQMLRAYFDLPELREYLDRRLAASA